MDGCTKDLRIHGVYLSKPLSLMPDTGVHVSFLIIIAFRSFHNLNHFGYSGMKNLSAHIKLLALYCHNIQVICACTGAGFTKILTLAKT